MRKYGLALLENDVWDIVSGKHVPTNLGTCVHLCGFLRLPLLETRKRWGKGLNSILVFFRFFGFVFSIPDRYSIIEVKVPRRIFGGAIGG